MARYGMVIDTKRCVGCNACSVNCKITNNLPETNWWTRVLTEGGDEVCPVGATYKDPETGVVRQDYDKCIGCRMCMAACPYTGVRSFNWEEPKYPVDHAVGDADVPKHQKHVVEKCTFCYQRLAREEVPACMELCPARARHFGDFDDPDSEVSKLVKERSYEQLLASEGTKPSVYYLV